MGYKTIRFDRQQLYEQVWTKIRMNQYPSINPESKFAKWLVWASLQADRLDPLNNSPPSILNEERPRR